jgi:drug/metabolite transporter (DMT)-like permease
VANATLFANCAPIFVTLGAWLIFRQRITRLFVVGMVAALAGATVLMGTSLQISTRHLFGDALGVLTAVFYTGYILSVKELRRDFGTVTIMFWVGVASSAALAAIAVVTGESLFGASARGWMVLVGLALVSQVGGQGLIAYALAYLPATFSSVTLLLQPVLAAIFAWIILSEVLGPLQALGGVAVLVGIFLARRGSRFF